MMPEHEKVNILLVDDQPSKLLSYEVILHDLGESLIKASSGREALEHLLKSEIAVVLVDVCMPDLDGFQLAAMIREHPRFQKTAMIFISAIHLTDMDRLRGYEMGAVDYVPVPVIPEVLRAKVKVFAELYRKTRQLERVNAELEGRVFARTAELEASTKQLRQSEERRSLALVAGNMGSWDWNQETGDCLWDDGQYRIFGVDRGHFAVSAENVRALVHPDDWSQLQDSVQKLLKDRQPTQAEFRVKRPNGEVRWCHGSAAPSLDPTGKVLRISGVTVDITDRKQAEERQTLLAREVDHRAKNALAVVQSIVRLTRAPTIEDFIAAVEGRIRALSRAHTILSLSRWQGADLHGLVDEELAPYRNSDGIPDRGFRPPCVAAARGRPVPGSRPPRACHQRRQIRSAFRSGWPRRDEMVTGIRKPGPALDRTRRAGNRGADRPRLRHADHQGQHRRTARRANGLRVGHGRRPMLPFRAARQRRLVAYLRQRTARPAESDRAGSTPHCGARQSRPGR